MRAPNGLLLVGLAVGVLIASTPVPAQAPPPAADLAARLQARYATIRDFSADFTQTIVGILRKRPTTEKGKMLVKKPLRVRFTYESPEKKEFVSDGTTFFSYFPESTYGTKSPLPRAGEESTALLFLAGRGNLATDFNHTLDPASPAGEWHLKLEPRRGPTDFEALTLFVDRQSLRLVGFTTTDEQGTNTLRLSNIRENRGLNDREFEFTFPPGTEIGR
jgi:outer membrane lipoprotein carrier protein